MQGFPVKTLEEFDKDAQADNQELPLDEMPAGVVDLVTASCAAVACIRDCGVVDFSEHGHPESATQYIDLMDATLDHGGVFNSRELEKSPLELVKLEAREPTKFYPVDDGLGGGAVFTDNASAQEYLHLEEGRRMLRCAGTEELGVGSNSTHVLRCRENPNAKPVYYIFEDNDRHAKDTFQFTDEYLGNEQRKFTGLTYVTAHESAPWVQPALVLLEKRLRSPAAIVEQARAAHVARRPEHTDEEMIDARALDRVNRRRNSINTLKVSVNVFIGVARMQRGGRPH
ncbi:hypothetical protein CYMTET_42856 [Cymbomonas tetramitiformis]|uniref:Uncharacterized protein n=1 Tax=Cymbomonas tetramitiformis TaxID=36881 RepID=A0AAE0C5E9_9CHLO|nr:hypothetical protein CYMTET_42856 [Cymbomonas tetramitiformis]